MHANRKLYKRFFGYLYLINWQSLLIHVFGSIKSNESEKHFYADIFVNAQIQYIDKQQNLKQTNKQTLNKQQNTQTNNEPL